jgi:hypothetical protein
MPHPLRHPPRLALLAFLCLCACQSLDKQQELEQVAKDWSLLLRASQVIPVYPMTQDLMPGDLFLVREPIATQQKIYQDKGYLPLDQHLKRISPKGYADFYANSFGLGSGGAKIPASLRFQKKTADAPFSAAPRAAFPTYTFSMEKGGAFQLALPVQAVPIGLSLLGTSKARGSLVLSDAFTYGVDEQSLWEQVRSWAVSPQGRDYLRELGAQGKGGFYLRVVTRVYLVGAVNVSVDAAEGAGGGLDAGVPSPIQLLLEGLEKQQEAQPEGNQTADLYAQLLSSLTEQANKQGPAGASIRVLAASARNVSLQERFDAPLVIGYLGFDARIDETGKLGPPLPTQGIIDGRIHRPAMAQFDQREKLGKILKKEILRRALEDPAFAEKLLTTYEASLDRVGKNDLRFLEEFKKLDSAETEKRSDQLKKAMSRFQRAIGWTAPVLETYYLDLL